MFRLNIRSEEAKHPGGRNVQGNQERIGNQVKELEWRGGPDDHTLRLPDGEDFGGLLSDDQVQYRNGCKSDNEGQRVNNGFGRYS